MKDLSDIELTYNNIIDTLLASRAHSADEFKQRAESVKEQLEESGLKYLDVSKDVLSFISWAIELMVVDTKIIRNYQEFVTAILENINFSELELEKREQRIQELEEQLEALREKNANLKKELEGKKGVPASSPGEKKVVAESKEEVGGEESEEKDDEKGWLRAYAPAMKKYVAYPDTYDLWQKFWSKGIAKVDNPEVLKTYTVQTGKIPVSDLKPVEDVQPLQLNEVEIEERLKNPLTIFYGVDGQLELGHKSQVDNYSFKVLVNTISMRQPIFLTEVVRLLKAKSNPWKTAYVFKMLKHLVEKTGRLYILGEILKPEKLAEYGFAEEEGVEE